MKMEEQTHGSNFKVPPQDHLFTTPSRTEPSTFPLKKLPPELSAKLTTFVRYLPAKEANLKLMLIFSFP